MNAFDEAIERIDEIDAPQEIKPTMIKAFEFFSKYFDEHKEIKIDFYQLFEKDLYYNPQITKTDNLKVNLVDSFEETHGTNTRGTYNPYYNILSLLNKEIYVEFDVHAFIHEFIHFMIHRTYGSKLPTWADEMMTECSAKAIHGAYYENYKSLVSSADFINQKVELLSIEQFFNGEFQKKIDQYKLDSLDNVLDELRQEKNVESNRTALVCHFINLKSKDLLKENKTFDEYVNEIINFSFSNFSLEKKQIIDEITNCVLNYMKDKFDISFNQNIQDIQEYVNSYYVQKNIEYNAGCKILVCDKIIFNGSVSYIAYGENGDNFVLFNHNGDTSYYGKLSKKYSMQLCLTKSGISNGTNINCPCGIEIIDERGEKDETLVLKYNEQTKRYEFPKDCEHKYYECKDDALFKDLKSQLERIAYQNKCKSFDSRQMGRIESYDSSIERRLKEINQIAKLLDAEIYCTPPSIWRTGIDPEESAIVKDPMYNLKNIEEKKLKKVSSLDVDAIQTLLEDVEWGNQVNFVVKDEKGKLIPLANVIKNYEEGEFSLHTNYNAFMDKLPNAQKENIYKKYVPKEELFKGEN